MSLFGDSTKPLPVFKPNDKKFLIKFFTATITRYLEPLCENGNQ